MTAPRPSLPRRDEVVVTGLGIVSALGTGCDAHQRALHEGRDGLRAVARFDTSLFSCRLAGCWPAWDGQRQAEAGPQLTLEAAAAAFPVAELAICAAREALARSGLAAAIERGEVARARVGLVLGTCFGQAFTHFHGLSEEVAAALGVAGPCVTVSTACASSANAVGLGRDLVQSGECDAVLAGGADVLLREIFAGFAALGVLSPEACAPFSEPVGTNLAEGAAFLALEAGSRAERRGARALAAIHGYGLSADAFHETTPDPSGAGIARAIRGALRDAGWRGPDVDYVNAHATGTLSHDRTEWTALCSELGPRRAPLAVSGLKSWVGHAQGAAGAVELSLALLAALEGRVVPSLHFRGPRPGCPEDPIASATPRALRVARALKVSAAFGGANAVLAYGEHAAGQGGGSAPRALRPVWVRDVALVSPAGSGLIHELAAALGDQHRLHGPALEPDLARIDPSINPRRLDRSSRMLTAAAALCLGERRKTLRGEARERVGVFLGACRMPYESASRCKESLRRGGASAISASAFARMSVNAPAGACAMTLGLKGPSTTLSIGEGSGLLSIALAARWLAERDDADCLVAGALDERDLAFGDPQATEGAVCALLEASVEGSAPGAPSGGVEIAGVGIAGAGALATAALRALGGQPELDGVFTDGEVEAVQRSLAGALPELSRLPLGVVDAGRTWGAGEACRSAFAFGMAVERLRQRSARSLLVVAAASRSSSVALLLRRREG